MLESINLSLSSVCGADCIYCPDNIGKSIKQKYMPIEIVDKILKEIASDDFRNAHNVSRIIVGEQGDAFLNINIMEILKLIRDTVNNNIHVELFTNFQNINERQIRILLKDNLVDYYRCNIDGSNNKSYMLSKKIDFCNSMNNLKTFITIRRELGKDNELLIAVLPYYKYVNAVYKHYGFYPDKMKGNDLNEGRDSFLKISAYLQDIVDLRYDKVIDSSLVTWAERDNIDVNKINYQSYTCPNIKRIMSEAFIAPDGSWYACCLDSANELRIGNIMENSLSEMYASEYRTNLISSLSKKDFEIVGGPCLTVNACQSIVYDDRTMIEKLKSFIRKYIAW